MFQFGREFNMSAFRQRIRAFRHAVKLDRPFAGSYSSFWTVPAHSGYGSREWADNARKTALADRRERGELGLLRSKRPSKMALPLVTAMLAGPGHTFRVLDFGGGAGADASLLTTMPGLEFTYHVVDLPHVIAVGREIWADRTEVTFSSELPPPESRFDLVYAWSAVQYVSNPFALFDRFVNFDPAAILLVFHQVAAATFVTGQVNLGPQPVPQWVFGLDELRTHFSARGYRLALGASSNKQFTENAFDLDHRNAEMADLLFLKDKPQ
jgi:putative methyltransferase (TIGR04325 family)